MPPYPAPSDLFGFSCRAVVRWGWGETLTSHGLLSQPEGCETLEDYEHHTSPLEDEKREGLPKIICEPDNSQEESPQSPPGRPFDGPLKKQDPGSRGLGGAHHWKEPII
ncbi:hypothetical protein GJAV_G00089490 [Gymnothorax javanicus]|nr:hypothetical protein GJAV_G00089490 [Gymnothorax javanicus]